MDLVILGEAPACLATEVVRGELLYMSDSRAQAEHDAPSEPEPLPPLPAHRMGAPKVDLADRDALYRTMEGR